MKKFLSIILAVSFTVVSSLAEIVNEIEISGNKRVSDETIKVYGGINENENVDADDDGDCDVTCNK